MNSFAYMQKISKDFGGLKRIELYHKLLKLSALVEKETRAKQYTEQPTVTTVLELELHKQQTPPDHTRLSQNDFAGNSEYNRIMTLIHKWNNRGWIYIIEVPDDLFRSFMIIADMHEEIEFDKERDYQYFQINGFKRKRL